MYSIDTQIRYSEIDEDTALKPLALVNLLQDTCTFQSEGVGNGVKVLGAIDRAWVINSWHIKIFKNPCLTEKVTVSTYPYEIKGFFGLRCFDIKNEAGEVLVAAHSVWTFLDTKSMRPARVPDEVKSKYEMDEMLDYGWEGRKVKIPGELTFVEKTPVRNYHIDTNHHVNNAWYVQIAREALPTDYSFDEIRVEYKKSAVMGDNFNSYINMEADKACVVLMDDNKEVYVAVEFNKRGRINK